MLMVARLAANALALFLLAVPLAASAQQPAQVPRIGLLSSFFASDTARWHEAFRQGLRDLGWVEGKNISIEYRIAEGRIGRLPDLAADLVRLKVDIIVAATTPESLAAKHATRATHHPEFLRRIAAARDALKEGRGVRLEKLPS